MFAEREDSRDAVRKSLASGCLALLCVLYVDGQEGNGCGYTLLGAESGTLSSQNYPGTYPSNIWCRWRLRVPEGRTLQLLFGDFDVETSPACSNGSLVISDKKGELKMGPLCGRLHATPQNVTLDSNEATVTFRSGPHRSGRGFLISYATDLHPDLISCLQRGSHFSSQHLSMYCPAGCKSVTGDVWGNSELGYRDTSVLCKSAVHAGATSDSVGGRIAVTRGRSLTLYESAFSNGILSKMGSLSEKKLLFIQECNSILPVSGLNASSFWDKDGQKHRTFPSSTNMDVLLWTADSSDPNPWLEIELLDRSNVTGIITTGLPESYIESFSLYFSKDRRNWKPYRGGLSRDKKVFLAYTEGHLRVLNSLFPAMVARFVRLQPIHWRGGASAKIQVMGCQTTKTASRRRTPEESPPVKVTMETKQPHSTPSPSEAAVIMETTQSSRLHLMVVVVGVVLGLVVCGSFMVAGVWFKRRKKDSQMKFTTPSGCQSIKSLSCPASELVYPLQRNVHDALPAPPLNDYAAVGHRLGSTFRPSSGKDYSAPLASVHYDTPASLPEYAEPLPPEPEYATPFSELSPEAGHGPPVPSAGVRAAPSHRQYDCPSHCLLFNGYCTPAANANGPPPTRKVYAEPKASDDLLHKHTYEEPL
ncbi:discoidin, CUB and LCCL domain-containing protein 1 isoform X2 [Oryzias latipes]|uniref:discoidin, CUB and LCCL domain-containing protein 1 isoform X2 n=1 Tax=Oryzias latipes TaxID=8090 RepID=UPI0005CBCB09|nr:discoidin, CUB and LCCL domain-containing protein 1 isoform X2 [Oryzias latipes]